MLSGATGVTTLHNEIMVGLFAITDACQGHTSELRSADDSNSAACTSRFSISEQKRGTSQVT